MTRLDEKKCSLCYRRASAAECTLYSIIHPIDKTHKIMEEEEKEVSVNGLVTEGGKRSLIVRHGDKRCIERQRQRHGQLWTN